MQKPQKPIPTDCCGSGCPRCVYDIYLEQLAEYRKWLENQEEKKNKSEIE